MIHTKPTVKLFGLAMALTAALSLPALVAAAGGPPENRGTGVGQNTYVVNSELDPEEQAILAAFLIDEHRALATYESIMADFGEIAPFSAIARAEGQHIAALERVFVRYGIDLPEIPTFDVPSFASPEEAASAGVQAEVDNAALYDRLLSGIDNADVVRVATNLRNASLNNHLPAFQAFADGTYVAGQVLSTQNQIGSSGAGMMGRSAGMGVSVAGQASGRRALETRALDTPFRLTDETCPAYQDGTYRGR